MQGSGTTEELEKGASFAASRERWERIVLKLAVHFKLSVTNKGECVRAAALLLKALSCVESTAAVATLGNLVCWNSASFKLLVFTSRYCTKTRTRLLI